MMDLKSVDFTDLFKDLIIIFNDILLMLFMVLLKSPH